MSKQAVIECASADGFWHSSISLDDVLIRTSDSSQSVFIGTTSNALPAIQVSHGDVTVAGTLTATAYVGIPADAAGAYASNNIPAAMWSSNAVPDGKYASNAIVGAAPSILFSSNTAVSALGVATWSSNNVGVTSYWHTSNSTEYTLSNTSFGSSSNAGYPLQVAGDAGIRRLLIGRSM